MIKYMILSLAVFSAALLLTGCSAEADGAYKKISASEAKEMMDKGNVTIVDVREPFRTRTLSFSCTAAQTSEASRHPGSSFPWATSTSMTLAAFLTGLMKSRINIPLNKKLHPRMEFFSACINYFLSAR